MNSKYILHCARCGKSYDVHKITYRIQMQELDIEEFRSRSCLGVDLCYRCNKEVEEFIFGKPEEMTELDENSIKYEDLMYKEDWCKTCEHRFGIRRTKNVCRICMERPLDIETHRPTNYYRDPKLPFTIVKLDKEEKL